MATLPRPRFYRPSSSDVLFPIEDPTVQARQRKTTYRVGALAPEKSSLPMFVLIGIAVGLFAFIVMSFCQPTQARAASLAPVAVDAPAAFTPAPVVPAMATAAIAVVAEPLIAKPARHRRASKSKKPAPASN